MNSKMNKTKILIITVIICFIITLGATLGISFYTYDGYIVNKDAYFKDYFDMNETKNETNQTKLQNIMKWTASQYIEAPGVIEYRDPSSKEVITENALTSDDAANVGAYVKDSVLSLPKYFDVNVYAQNVQHYNEETDKIENTFSYQFFFTNINYNSIKDFSPEYIYITFVNGTGAESDEELQAALDEMNESGVSTGNISNIWTYTFYSKDETAYSYVSYDNARDIYDDEDENDTYYIYRNYASKSYDNSISFGETADLTFSIYYMDDSDDGNKKLINLVEGTYSTPLINGEILNGENISDYENHSIGYNESLKQDSYNKFITPKVVRSAVLTFVIVGAVCALLAFVMLFDVEHPTKLQKNKKQKAKK